jgi:hypothetical protein
MSQRNCSGGPDLIEYALVAVLIGLGALAAMKGLANQTLPNPPARSAPVNTK